MATSAITPDQNVVTAEIFIAAPPERVFQALLGRLPVGQHAFIFFLPRSGKSQTQFTTIRSGL